MTHSFSLYSRVAAGALLVALLAGCADSMEGPTGDAPDSRGILVAEGIEAFRVNLQDLAPGGGVRVYDVETSPGVVPNLTFHGRGFPLSDGIANPDNRGFCRFMGINEIAGFVVVPGPNPFFHTTSVPIGLGSPTFLNGLMFGDDGFLEANASKSNRYIVSLGISDPGDWISAGATGEFQLTASGKMNVAYLGTMPMGCATQPTDFEGDYLQVGGIASSEGLSLRLNPTTNRTALFLSFRASENLELRLTSTEFSWRNGSDVSRVLDCALPSDARVDATLSSRDGTRTIVATLDMAPWYPDDWLHGEHVVKCNSSGR